MSSPADGRRVAIYPGSFDPVTLGHVDIIRRAAPLFDRLHVAILENPGKTPWLGLDDRLALLRESLVGIGDEAGASVEIGSFRGLTVEYARRVGARWIVRGLRSSEDAGYELPMAQSNRRCGEAEVETLLLPASAEVAFVSSRLVRQIAREGGRLEAFVPACVERVLRARKPS